jgi:hypothetical protein
MNTEKLLYRRQFIFAPKDLNSFPSWKKYNILDKFMLYAHPDLPQSEYSEGKKRLILLGDLYDPDNFEFDNSEILASLINNNSIIKLLESSFKYAGRFVLFFILNESVYVFHDSGASRKIYYTVGMESMWCGSKPHVIAKYSGINKTSDKTVLDFYNSDDFKLHENADVYTNTIYDNIKHLPANFYLDIQMGKAFRYWPNKKLIETSLDQGVERGAKMLSGILKSINFRYNLMIPVTAGFDSRLILAATKEIKNDPYFYILKNRDMSDSHQDITIPSRLLSKQGLTLNIIEYSNDVDKEFREIYFKNDEFANEKFLPIIYNVFYKRFQDKINLPGLLSGISRNYFDTYKKNITADILVKRFKYENNKLAYNSFKEWIDGVQEIAYELKYDIGDLFNWEENNGNLHTKVQSNKDIAQDEFAPFNCRNLLITFLSVPKKYRNRYTNIFYKAMIKYMWPELLSEPFNPNLWKYYYATKLRLYWTLRWLKKGW